MTEKTTPRGITVLQPLAVDLNRRGRRDHLLQLIGARRDAGERLLLVLPEPESAAGLPDPGVVEPGFSPGSVQAALGEEIRALAEGLGLERPPSEARHLLAELERLLTGVGLTSECGPAVAVRLRALVAEALARTVAGGLQQGGRETAVLDPVSLLCTRASDDPDSDRLGARPEIPHSGEWPAETGLVCLPGACVGHPDGGPALPDEGGAATVAALAAARVGADCLLFLTEMRGLYSADPRRDPGARLLTALDYEEAIEITTAGGGLLHPAALEIARDTGVAVGLRAASDHNGPGTDIGPAHDDTQARVKAVVVRHDVTLVSMATVGMWRRPGFLAEAFSVFARHGISIGLVSTSETSVTVSLEGQAPSDDRLQQLIDELNGFCRAEMLSGRGAVSVVGRRIRSILHRLGSAFEVFEEYPVHLLSQAANDLNFTVVTGPDQAERLAGELHRSLVHPVPGDPVLGPTRQQLRGKVESPAILPTRGWWWQERERLEALAEEQAPAFVYYLPRVREAIDDLAGLPGKARVLYAVKANPHPALLGEMAAAGFGFECVSPAEIDHVRHHRPELDPGRILFTPNFAPRDEYRAGLDAGVQVTLDNLHPLRHWPELFQGHSLFLRIDPGQGRGHHRHVQTAGVQSKFGIPLDELDSARKLAEAAGARITGLHAHSGSGIRSPDNWRQIAAILGEAAEHFPDVTVLDLGGGFGVVEKPGDRPLDITALGETLDEVGRALAGYKLWLEPGRYLSAPAGVLLARVTQTKGKGAARYVGVETGMNSLIRPALYGAWHGIVNLSRPDARATETATVVGPICETGDVLGSDRLLPECREGDVLAILNAGAYGRVMSSSYNLREPAREVVIDG